MKKEISNKITYLTFILSLTIVWHHAYNVEVYNLTGLFANIEKILLFIFEGSVPVFLCLSAFLFYYNYDETKYLSKLKKRVFSLLIPYLIWNLIGYFYFQIISLIPIVSSNYGGHIETFSIIGMIKSMVSGDYNLVTWFLRSLIIYTVVFPLFYKLFKNKKISFVLVLVFLYISIVFTKYDSLAYSVYYVIGIVLGTHYKNRVIKNYDNKEKIISLFVLLILIVLNYLYRSRYISIISYSIFPIVIWILTDFLSTSNSPKWFMKVSFVIFVSHEMILEPIEKIIYLVLGSNEISAIIDFTFAPILTVIIIILICSIVRKNKIIWSLLSGNR